MAALILNGTARQGMGRSGPAAQCGMAPGFGDECSDELHGGRDAGGHDDGVDEVVTDPLAQPVEMAYVHLVASAGGAQAVHAIVRTCGSTRRPTIRTGCRAWCRRWDDDAAGERDHGPFRLPIRHGHPRSLTICADQTVQNVQPKRCHLTELGWRAGAPDRSWSSGVPSSKVMALPVEDRAELAAELLASLDDQVAESDPGEVDLAWGEEMVRRSQQVTSGEAVAVTCGEVRVRVAERRSGR